MTNHAICCISCGKPQPNMKLIITKNLIPPTKALKTKEPCSECLREEFKKLVSRDALPHPVTADHLL